MYPSAHALHARGLLYKTSTRHSIHTNERKDTKPAQQYTYGHVHECVRKSEIQ